MINMTGAHQRLIEAAKNAALSAYCPYSDFPVGAAILSSDDEVFCGCNIENVSFPCGVCAEQSALSAAILKKKKKFLAIAIYSKTGATPCGKCRQLLSEFGDMWIICADYDGNVKSYTLSKLLPDSFHKI
ncbi:MAG: cytidine deaminase [Oscillospiraceae bacterium]